LPPHDHDPSTDSSDHLTLLENEQKTA
jgi:hypothetical protein